MKKLLIVKAGTTFGAICQRYGDFDDHIINQIGLSASEVVIAPVYNTKTMPSLKDVSAVIITGSHAMVTDREDWSINLAQWLRESSVLSIPILGICYGHQLIASAWGGIVDYHPDGKEVGTVSIELTEAGKSDALLGSMPEKFLGHVTHAQTVIKLPGNARLLAKNDFEPHHAFVINDHIWGVQFHPEFSGEIIRSYIQEQSPALIRDGFDSDKLNNSVKDHSYGKHLLRRFIDLAQKC